MSLMGEIMAQGCQAAVGLGQQLAGDIDAAKFATNIRSGETVIDANHPAFAYGHLAIYPPRLLEILGQDASSVAVPASWAELFEAGKNCVDDPKGEIYPSKDEIMKAFVDGYKAVAEALPAIEDSVFAEAFLREGKASDRFPTKGSLASFLAGPHNFMHLGQVSTWRRCFGYGSAM